ncbi:MAG: DUF881 domain-containing protein [Clostridia bacterium]|nr:DUF881 domain-containing protein [Clostridia bacterium]
MKKNSIAILLGVVCAILVYAISIQLKTIDELNKTVSGSISENGLRDEVLKWKGRYDSIYAKLQEEESRLEKVRKEASSDDEASAGTREELKLVNRMLGFTEVTGKGITIVLDDNKAQIAEGVLPGTIADYLVHDDDLIRLVNDLKNGGAEAISINEQRIVSTTGIVCDGNVVRINGQKVSAPFEIKAIGYPERLIGTLNFPEAILSTLRSVGVVKEEPKKSNSITIPKYTGTISIKNLSALEGQGE